MARGFEVTVMVQTVEDFTEEALKAEVEANGQLSELESETYLPGAVAAAISIMETLGDGPFTVRLHGTDRTQETGEWNRILVEVTSTYTAPSPVAAAPDTGVAEAPETDGVGSVEARSAAEGDALNADSPETPLAPPAGSVEGSDAVVPPEPTL